MAITMARRAPIPGLLALILFTNVPALAQDAEKKPSLALRASPSIAFAPARIFLRAEVRGGPDDYQEFYCAGVEWDWGDGTRSENKTDCPPFEPGKSQIRRQYAVEHVYRQPGRFHVTLRLKQGNRTVGSATTQVQVRGGLPGER